MIEHCIQCWVLGLVAGYAHHLSKAKKELEGQLQMKQKDVEGTAFLLYYMLALNVLLVYFFRYSA